MFSTQIRKDLFLKSIKSSNDRISVCHWIEPAGLVPYKLFNVSDSTMDQSLNCNPSKWSETGSLFQ